MDCDGSETEVRRNVLKHEPEQSAHITMHRSVACRRHSGLVRQRHQDESSWHLPLASSSAGAAPHSLAAQQPERLSEPPPDMRMSHAKAFAAIWFSPRRPIGGGRMPGQSSEAPSYVRRNVCITEGCRRLLPKRNHRHCCSRCPHGTHTRRCERNQRQSLRQSATTYRIRSCWRQAELTHALCCSECKRSKGRHHSDGCYERQHDFEGPSETTEPLEIVATEDLNSAMMYFPTAGNNRFESWHVYLRISRRHREHICSSGRH